MHIDRIETAGPDKRARRIFYDGGEVARTTSASVVRAVGLEEGALIESDLDELLGDAELAQAKERALRLLGYRERSTGEVRQRLGQDGYPRSVVDAVIERLTELALIDDERFAASWCRSRRLAGYGPSRVRSELLRRGLSKDLAEQALLEAYDGGDAVEMARRALRGRIPESPQDRQKALRRLISKGFDLPTALRAIEGED